MNGPLNETFEIVWFKQSVNSTGRLMKTSGKIDFRNTMRMFILPESRQILRRSSLLRVSHLNEQDDIGLYWCQISVSRSNGSFLLEQSNALSLNRVQSYNMLNNCRQDDDELSMIQPMCVDILQATTISPPQRPPTTVTNVDPELETTAAFRTEPRDTRTDDATTEGDSSLSSNQAVALFSVLGVIFVFSAVIITLTVVIVILYRKRYGHMGFKKTAGKIRRSRFQFLQLYSIFCGEIQAISSDYTIGHCLGGELNIVSNLGDS